MPHSNSAKKRLRQNEKANARNRAGRTAIRNEIRKVRELITSGDVEASRVELRVASRKLDQAASKQIIHRNAAARTKSRLSAAVKRMPAPAAP